MLALRLHSFPIVTTIKPVSFIASHILYTTDKFRKAFVDTHPATDARFGKQGMAFHCQICRCITLPGGHSIHGTLAIVRWGQWETPLAGSHRNKPIVPL